LAPPKLFVKIRHWRQANIEFANILDKREDFANADFVRDRNKMDAKSWWIVHGS